MLVGVKMKTELSEVKMRDESLKRDHRFKQRRVEADRLKGARKPAWESGSNEMNRLAAEEPGKQADE